MILDTHKEIIHLKELGFDEKKAEGIVQLHVKTSEQLATKADIAHLEDIMKFDRTLLVGIFLMMLVYLIKTFVH
jgi:hypothetical protein